MFTNKSVVFCLLLILSFFSCEKDEPLAAVEPKLIIKLELDANQIRLGNTGTASTLPDGHAGQIPAFNELSAHYLELAPNANTFLGEGTILYQAPETNKGGDLAIDFDQSEIVKPGDVFLEIPIHTIQVGTYEWVRLSLSYQNYNISFHFEDQAFTGTLASFVGFNTYITDHQVKDISIEVDANKRQGYWAFESFGQLRSGLAPAGATTVPNPLFDSSPIPAGSCVVTGKFDEQLVISGNETEDITLSLSLSINDSFEWKDLNGNGKWDVDPGANETIVDMGLRGLIPSFK